jgi:hypothetical protein
LVLGLGVIGLLIAVVCIGVRRLVEEREMSQKSETG